MLVIKLSHKGSVRRGGADLVTRDLGSIPGVRRRRFRAKERVAPHQSEVVAWIWLWLLVRFRHRGGHRGQRAHGAEHTQSRDKLHTTKQ